MPRRRQYDQIAKRRAASLYVVHASSLKVSEATGIPARTIRTWTTTEWWAGYVTEAQTAMEAELDAMYTAIIDLSGQKTLERLEQGDCRVGRDGQLVHVPVSARDTATVGAIAFDKRSLLRGRPTVIRETTSPEHLERLADQFRQIAARVITQ